RPAQPPGPPAGLHTSKERRAGSVRCNGWFGPVTYLMPSEHKRQTDYENDYEQDPPDDFPDHGRGIATLATHLARHAPTVGDVDSLKVLGAAERAATLTPGGRGSRTRITLRPRWRSRSYAIGMATLGAGFRLGRDLPAAGGTSAERHRLLRCSV